MTSKNPLPLFYGNSTSDEMSVTQWCTHTELTADAYKWDEPKCCIMARLVLRGPALQWVEMLGNEFTWAHFKAQIINRYGEKPEQILDKIRCRVQGLHESVASYTDDYFSLLTRAGASDNPIPAQMQKSGYIEGLLPSLRTFVLLQNPTAIMEASEAARSWEFQAQRNLNEKSIPAFPYQPNQNRNARLPNRFDAQRPNNRPSPYQQNMRDANNYSQPQFIAQQNGYNNQRGPQQQNGSSNQRGPPNQNRNFNPRQQPGNITYSRSPPRNINSAVEDLTQQMGDMQIKMSQMDPPSDFNHFELEDCLGLHMIEDEADCLQHNEITFPPSSSSQNQIFYNNEYSEPYYQEEYPQYDQERWSEEPFDQFLDTDHPMPDAGPISRRRPLQRAGFSSNPAAHQRQNNPPPQRPAGTRGFQPQQATRTSPPQAARPPAAANRPGRQGVSADPVFTCAGST